MKKGGHPNNEQEPSSEPLVDRKERPKKRKQQTRNHQKDLRQPEPGYVPEGLKRKRKGPYSKDSGRH